MLKRKYDAIQKDVDNYLDDSNNINESNNNESSDSSSDSDIELNINDNEYKLITLKLFKHIITINKNLNTISYLDIINKEIINIKKIFKKRLTENIYLDKLKIELKYANDLLNLLKKEYKKNKKLDLLSFINTYENYYNSQIKPNSMPMMYTILVNDELEKEFLELYNFDTTNNDCYTYFQKLNKLDKISIIDNLKKVKEESINIKPNLIQVLEWDTCNNNKSVILSKLNQFDNLHGNSEYFKLKTWINKIMKVPFGVYIKPVVSKDNDYIEIKTYIDNLKEEFDNNIYGHDITKEQLIKIIGHTITNPTEGGSIFALEGPPGVGKTAFIHDCIAKVLNRPFAFISLGGATDACFLEGHDYTYEGSNHGKIVELLIETKCMNPIIYFDELDKVSDTPKGEEIINILMHLTDTTQNFAFNDKFFRGINFDLSKTIIIFSFNDASKISRILRDRMKIIKVKGYKLQDKLIITKNHILPKLIKSIGLKNIKFDDDIIEYIIENYTNESGVRKLKEILFDILLEINLRNLKELNYENNIILTEKSIDEDFLNKKRKIEHITIFHKAKIGLVNGLWANSLGLGGLIPIECSWLPSNKKLELELTGLQGSVMKESMIVARTVAWKVLPNNIKNNITKSKINNGIHIHCPDGATPKDGPSAGAAITICLISLFTNKLINNKIAMTGEINLKGSITAIGGLEEKIFGAKKANVELILCPYENLKDLNDIKIKYPTLINDKFNIITVKTIWEIIDIILIGNNIKFIKF
jgi:ATP-dependent Lon protease